MLTKSQAGYSFLGFTHSFSTTSNHNLSGSSPASTCKLSNFEVLSLSAVIQLSFHHGKDGAAALPAWLLLSLLFALPPLCSSSMSDCEFNPSGKLLLLQAASCSSTRSTCTAATTSALGSRHLYSTRTPAVQTSQPEKPYCSL